MNRRGVFQKEPCLTQLNPFDFFSELLRAHSDQVIHMVLYFDGKLDLDRMQRAVMGAVLAEPVCNSRLVEVHDTLWWELRSDVHPGDSFSVIEKKDLDSALSYTLSKSIDPYEGLQIKVFIIRPIDGVGDVLVINASHVAMDGRGLKDITGLIMELYHHLTGDPPFITGIIPVVSGDLPLISTFLPPGAGLPGDKEFSSGGDRWTFPVQSREVHQKAYAVMTIPCPRVAAIHAKREELGVTVNDLMLAVVAMACSNLGGGIDPVECSFLTTIDLRRYHPIPLRSVTNYSTAFEVRIPVKPLDTLSSICGVVHEIMENKKNNCPGMKDALDAERLWNSGVSAARETLRTRVMDPKNYENQIPIVTNTGIIDFDLGNHCLPRVKKACMLPCHAPTPAIFVAISTYKDTMTISSTFHRPAVADGQVRVFFGWINRLLPGYTVSDDRDWLQLIPG
ncbi:MAG: hypothetical protein NTV68_12560 [Methanomicrobiales archaeon]|nr:hypothetical protein [Methanomicrobiales archaeon]